MSIRAVAWKHFGTGLKYWSFRVTSYLSGTVPLRFAYWVGTIVGDVVSLSW